MDRRLAWLVLFGLMSVSTAVGTALGTSRLAHLAHLEPGANTLDVIQRTVSTLHLVSKQRWSGEFQRVAFLGDSTSVVFRRGRQMPIRLERHLNSQIQGSKPVRVYSLAHPGFGVYCMYFVADRVARAKPDLLVWQVSLVHFADSWARQTTREEFAGWMAAERLPQAALLPLASAGLTLDELLLYQAIVRSHHETQWRNLRDELSRIDKWRTWLESWLDTVVFLNPINLDNLSEVGVLDPHGAQGLKESVGILRALVEDAGATFIDAHDILPDPYFKDGSGHFVDREEIDSAGVLIQRIAPQVISHLDGLGER